MPASTNAGLKHAISSDPERWKEAFSLITRRTDVVKLPRHLRTSVDAPSAEPSVAPGQALVPVSNPSFTWTVLWDIENVSIPLEHNGAQIVHAMGKSLQKLRRGVVRRIVAFVDINKLRLVHRNELQSHGVLLMHVETAGRKDAADKALIVELMLTALDVPPPAGIALMSGDQDYAYPIAILRQRGYTTAVIAPCRIASSPLLTNVPEFVLSFKGDVLHGVPPVKRPLVASSAVAAQPRKRAAHVHKHARAQPQARGTRLVWSHAVFRDHRVQVLIMLLAAFSSVHLIRAAAYAVLDVIRSATLIMVFRACIDAFSLWELITHLVMGLLFVGTLRILRSTGAGFKGLVLQKTKRNHHFPKKKRRTKGRPTTLINPPNV